MIDAFLAGVCCSGLPRDHDAAAEVHRLHIGVSGPFPPHRMQCPGEQTSKHLGVFCVPRLLKGA